MHPGVIVGEVTVVIRKGDEQICMHFCPLSHPPHHRSLLSDPRLATVPIYIICNKQDVIGARSCVSITDAIQKGEADTCNPFLLTSVDVLPSDVTPL